MKAAHTALITVLLTAVCTQVRAVPIVFEFTGTVTERRTQVVGGGSVYDDSLIGVAYSASLTIDSDFLLAEPAQNSDGENWLKQFNDSEFGTPGVTGSLVIGDEVIELRPYSRNIGGVNFYDALDYVSQSFDGLVDGMSIGAYSRAPEPTFPAEGVRGAGRGLSFGAHAYPDPAGLGSFESISLDDLLTMPLPNATLNYLDVYWTCETIYCIQVPSTMTSFSIDTMTRRIASVPEPATLGLFALGLLGAAGARRRRVRA